MADDPRPRDQNRRRQVRRPQALRGRFPPRGPQGRDDVNWLKDPNYSTLRLRQENAHAAVEAAIIEASRARPSGGRDRQEKEDLRVASGQDRWA
jgi:hypothetical protein